MAGLQGPKPEPAGATIWSARRRTAPIKILPAERRPLTMIKQAPSDAPPDSVQIIDNNDRARPNWEPRPVKYELRMDRRPVAQKSQPSKENAIWDLAPARWLNRALAESNLN